MARTKRGLWSFDDGEREILFAATAEIPELRAVIARAPDGAPSWATCG